MTITMRQVRFPLKLKLLTLMIILICSSLIVFVGIAIKIFKEDKSAYIYETLLNKATSEQIILTQKLKALNAGAFKIQDATLKLGDSDPQELLNQNIDEGSPYKTKIIIPVKNLFFEYRNKNLKALESSESKILAEMIKGSVLDAVRDVEIDGENYLYAFNYNPELNYAYVVTLPTEKAFEVTSYLINKSLYYGIFILGVAMLLSVLLSKPLTSQLEKLFGMTQEIAAGNFEKRVSITGHDEVGALSDSINDMADKIVIYMNEMKEKARLENEVQVAKLVQSSFFPLNLNSDDSTYGFFEPASECGGDWWGYFDHGDFRVIFIADATGHGVPAALLTATINCCKSNLGFILETRPNLLREPQEILRFMNQAVCGAGKEIQVTCFVASFNRKTNELIYSNSSHTPALVFNPNSNELKRDSFQPLIEVNGPRLGQSIDTSYEAHHMLLQKHDTIFFYTDGLIEAMDHEGNRWGERRFLNSLCTNGKGVPKSIVEGVISDLQSFTQSKFKSDDITAVAMKVIS